MYKKLILMAILFCTGLPAFAQTDAGAVYDKYLDFNLARLQSENDKALELGESIIPDTAKLPAGARVSFYYSIAKLYEDNDRAAKAIPYYEKVIAAVPDYYVAHRALGYLFVKDLKETDPGYVAKVKKALPHLEKAQACDPSDDTLTLIRSLYINIKDETGLKTLTSRLNQPGKNCIDILNDVGGGK
jgi:tetratricopeptide (TPR) repeat protein